MPGQEIEFLTREQQFIEQIKSIIGAKFLGDDCALVAGGLLLSTDTLVEGNHFLSELTTMSDLGWKAMAVNLSDIAAMAGRPRYALVALTIPDKLSRGDFLELYGGIGDCARNYSTTVVGGDITSGPVLSITITVIGEVNERGCLKRAGAKSGDQIVVSGCFGSSSAALAVLLNDLQPTGTVALQSAANRIRADGQSLARSKLAYPYSMNQHFRPHPRLGESWQFVEQTGARGALMDASDGLADALAQIARASDVGMEIELTHIPIHTETSQIAAVLKGNSLDWALYGGEDYELVGCLSMDDWRKWNTKLEPAQIPFKKIGQVTGSKRIELFIEGKPGPELDLAKCFQHIAKVD